MDLENRPCAAHPIGPVLVTGGGGFLGRAIVTRLVGMGETVCSFNRSTYALLEELGVEQIRGDVCDAAAVAAACRGCRVVFHTAARAGVWGSEASFHGPNVTGTRNVVTACRGRHDTVLVHTSSPSVVFDGTDMEGVDERVPYPARFHAPYPRTKARAEQIVRRAAARGLAAVILRPHLIWGPGDNHLVPRILARGRRLRRIGDGRNRVDTIYIDNAVDAHLLAARRLLADRTLAGRIYFVSQDEPVPLWDMIDRILAAGGHPPVRGCISPRTALFAAAVLERLYGWLRIRREPPLTRFVVRELATAHWFDIAAARRDLGYRPRVDTAEGLRRLRRWLATGKGGVRTAG